VAGTQYSRASDDVTGSFGAGMGSEMARKSVIALTTVGVLVAIFTVCLVSALQLLEPREMPFGVTEPSPVVDAVQKEFSPISSPTRANPT
jgi:hypothetical protein